MLKKASTYIMSLFYRFINKKILLDVVLRLSDGWPTDI